MIQPMKAFYCGDRPPEGFHGIQISNIAVSVFEKRKLMDVKKQVTKWVEKKIGKFITKELKDKVKDENSSFDVNAYVNDLLERHFKGADVENLKKEIENEDFNENSNGYELDYSTEAENRSYDSLEFETNEFSTLSVEEIIKNLRDNSEEVRIESLHILEASAEDLINQKSWINVKKILLNILEDAGDKRTHVMVLKIFHKLLTCPSKPQVVCETFISLTELISFHVEEIYSGDGHISFEEIFDLKENKWLCKKTPSEPEKILNEESPKDWASINAEVLIKSMWLLIECQKQMPEKWIRFNERRLREIIFSFIHLLSSTTHSEDERIGLELLSILNPTATWCRHWCHTSVGRSLLCSALRKYKPFFIHIVEIILINMKTKRIQQSQTINENLTLTSPGTERTVSKPFKTGKENKFNEKEGERCKCVRSAPTVPTKKVTLRKSKMRVKWCVEDIPRRIVTQATFCHCMSLVVCLIQFRSGRSLFPVQTACMKRLLSVQDLVLSMIEYLENFEEIEGSVKGIAFTNAYKEQVVGMVKVLKSVEICVHSSRMSADRLPLSQR